LKKYGVNYNFLHRKVHSSNLGAYEYFWNFISKWLTSGATNKLSMAVEEGWGGEQKISKISVCLKNPFYSRKHCIKSGIL